MNNIEKINKENEFLSKCGEKIVKKIVNYGEIPQGLDEKSDLINFWKNGVANYNIKRLYFPDTGIHIPNYIVKLYIDAYIIGNCLIDRVPNIKYNQIAEIPLVALGYDNVPENENHVLIYKSIREMLITGEIVKTGIISYDNVIALCKNENLTYIINYIIDKKLDEHFIPFAFQISVMFHGLSILKDPHFDFYRSECMQ